MKEAHWLVALFVLFNLGSSVIGKTLSTTCACDPVSDSLSLVQLYQDMDGPNWINHNNWLVPGQPIGNWYGVMVNSQGCVEKVSLYQNNLSGELADYSFPEIEGLSLYFNKIRGEIPDFSKMPNLQSLALEGNRLAGEMPDFSNIPNLLSLSFSNNFISGSLPNFSNIPKLQFLVGSFNLLSGEIPNFLNLPDLIILKLTNNSFSGTIPDFSNFPVLGGIQLSNNLLSGQIVNFTNLPALDFLDLSYNSLSGDIPDFSGMPMLENLFLNRNELSGTIPNFTNLLNLKNIVLSNNKLSGNIPNFDFTPNLSGIDICCNQLIGQIPEFDNLIKLLSFNLEGNDLSGEIPDFGNLLNYNIGNNRYTFSDIISSNNLGYLNFIYYPQKEIYVDTLIHAIGGEQIEINLDIDSGLVSNEYTWYKDGAIWLPPAGNDPNSSLLEFQAPKVDDAGRYSATVTNPLAPNLTLGTKIIKLKVCDVQKDSIVLVQLYASTNGDNWNNNANWLVPGQSIDSWFGIVCDESGCISKIDLTGNGLIGFLPSLDLNTLDTLILQNNELTETIPEFSIPFVKTIDLSYNVLSGDFPQVLTSWVDLQSLNFGNNVIAGSIPPDLGDLCELSTLKLNNNLIPGELPSELTYLFNLLPGQVDFSSSLIDSLKDDIIWFCPFGDTILESSPSYDRFLEICGLQCSGDEWNDLESYPWIMDTLENINCFDPNCYNRFVDAGIVSVRGLKLIYTRNTCVIVSPKTGDVLSRETDYNYYNCGGKLLVHVHNGLGGYSTLFKAITQDEFEGLEYDIKWNCTYLGIFTNAVEDFDNTDHSTKKGSIYLNCYPNPADIMLTCTVTDILQLTTIQLFDILGRVYQVPCEQVNDQLRVQVDGLTQGLYFISVDGRRGKYLTKVIVE